ncbi:MAG: hypothetical protein ACJ710_13560 [Ornithinibacter sp.]
MRKTILGLAAIAAIASPVAFATSAHAATPGRVDTTTYVNGTSYAHQFSADYSCGVTDGHTVVNFTITGITPSGSGSGVLTPDTKGGGTFAFSGENNGYHYTYGGEYGSNGVWTMATAIADDGSYNFGTGGAQGGYFGSVVGSFTGIPDCAASEVPATVTDNHGEYVSGAARAGVKGKDFVAIAKNVNLVGPYRR